MTGPYPDYSTPGNPNMDPYYMSPGEEAEIKAARDENIDKLRQALTDAVEWHRGDLYLSEVHDIVGELLAKLKRQPGEPVHQVKMFNPIAAAPKLLKALKSLNSELDKFWNGDRSDEQVKRICAAQDIGLTAILAAEGAQS